jgi:hypothetical protein
MHTLVDMLHITWKEFDRNLTGLNDEDARRRIEPMNSISWIIAHVANQHQTFFNAWVKGKEIKPEYFPYGYGSPPSQPPLDEALNLWRTACLDADVWLKSAVDSSMVEIPVGASPRGESMGTLLTRCIFHTWCHLGEISSIRQVLGHKPPEFVNMYNWKYQGVK